MKTATKDTTYRIDPRQIFNKDVIANDGSVLAVKGQVVDPLDYFPGNKLTLIVFDALNEKHRRLVKHKMKSAPGVIKLLTSRMDPDAGLEFIREKTNDMGMMVYPLQQRIIERFQLQNLPAEIRIGDGKIVVYEYGMSQVHE